MTKRTKLLIIIASCAYAIAWYLVTQYAAQAYVNSRFDAQKEQARQQVSLAKSTFEAIIFKDIYLADSLATVVNIEPQFAIDNWESISAKLMAQSTHVRNVAMAPDDTIQFIYPLAGNERALGFEYQSRPEQFASVMTAKRTGNLVIDGPRQLVQGGVGLIARFPIFSDYPISMDYWGIVSVVIDYDKVMAEAGFNSLQRVDVAIQNDNATDNTQGVFFGSAAVFEQPDFSLPITLPTGHWQLAARYRISLDAAEQQLLAVLWLVSLIVASLAYLAVFMLIRSFRIAHQNALHDELTHLPNRRFLINYIDGLLTRWGQPPRFAVVNVDLNRFKKVNDDLGHDAGDELLKHIANHMLSRVRATDFVARIGGDEFIIVLGRVRDEAAIKRFVEKLKIDIERTPLEYQGELIYPSLSIGYSIADGNKTREALLSEADRDMYAMKLAQRTELS